MEDTRTHVRLARKDLGDDGTFSRYVKIQGFGKLHGKQKQSRLPSLELPAIRERRTFFLKSVKRVDQMTNLLVSGHSNVKIGRDVRVGKFVGWWLYTLSLQERATCPSSCVHWQGCYGNAMPYAKRIDHTDPDFLPALEANLDRLCAITTRPGIIVRLHALGDFYDVDYVGFWAEMLVKHPNMIIFGYTAYHPNSPNLEWSAIGQAIDKLVDTFPGRAMIRFSDGGLASRSTVSIVNAEDCPPGAFVCPEQTGQFEACGKCGACWTTLKNVAFMTH